MCLFVTPRQQFQNPINQYEKIITSLKTAFILSFEKVASDIRDGTTGLTNSWRKRSDELAVDFFKRFIFFKVSAWRLAGSLSAVSSFWTRVLKVEKNKIVLVYTSHTRAVQS